MNPTDLLPPTSPLGLPAPLWFIRFFKVFGFSLHMVPMNLWFAGILLSAVLLLFRDPAARRLSARLMDQMPIIIALGINFGVIPLLFIQVGYYRVFYPATILIAWPWFAVIGLVMAGYYGTYLYVVQLRRDRLTPWSRALGWIVAFIFMGVGFIFVNGLSLMSSPGQWPAVWSAAHLSGAATGLALDLQNASILPRWLLMFGLALTTVAVYSLCDATLLASREPPEYRAWVPRFALLLYSLGLVWAAAAGTGYILTMPSASRSFLLTPPQLALTVITALAPGLPWLLLILYRWRPARLLVLLAALSQFGMLVLNAVSRQFLQDAEVAPFAAVGAEPVNLQLVPLVLFLLFFLAGSGVVIWILVKVRQAETSLATASR
ncbi:MAG: hypothetical protein ABSB61_06120 [Anaerolineales bacterium]